MGPSFRLSRGMIRENTANSWYVDAATGEKKVLVSAAKLASLAPDYTKVKDEREKSGSCAITSPITCGRRIRST